MASSGKQEYKFKDAINGCDEAIEIYMAPADCVVYRVVHDPLHPNDEVPQGLQEWENLAQEQVSLPLALPEGTSIADQWQRVQEYSLSCFNSEDAIDEFFCQIYVSRKTERQKANFRKKKGETIIAIHVQPEDGVLQKEPAENGHLVFQPYKDFKLDEHLESSFKPRKLSIYERNEE